MVIVNDRYSNDVFVLKLVEKEMSLKLSPVFFLSPMWRSIVQEDINLGLDSSIDDQINLYLPYFKE